LEFAASWIALNRLITKCKGQERATLLLSTCRNAYMTANALFTELQVILGDGNQQFSLRAGAELLIKGSTADSDEVARVYRYEVARGFRDDVAHLSDLISPGGEAF